MALTRINGNLISSGTITGNLFLSNTITGNLIAPAAVTGDKIGLTAITGNLIAPAAVTGDKIASGVTITSPVIASANLTTALTLNGAAGTNGQVLTSAGSGLPSWTTPSSGAMVYISQVVASSASTVDIEDAFTDYETYMIIGTGITTTSDFNIRVKIGGAYITSGTYNYWGSGGYTGLATPTVQRGDDQAQIFAFGNGFSTVANFYLTISVKSGKKTFIKYEVNGDTTASAAYLSGAGTNTSTGALQGIRIFGSTYTGTFRLYGIVKS
jgi:hypothetical protein